MGNHPGYWAKQQADYDRQNPPTRAPRDFPEPVEYDPPTAEDIQAEAQYDRERSEFQVIVSSTDDATLRERLEDALDRGEIAHFQIDYLWLLHENIVNRFIAELTSLAGDFRQSLQSHTDRRLRELRTEIVAADPECEAVLAASSGNSIESWLNSTLDQIESPLRASRHAKEREIAMQKLEEVARRQKEKERKRQEEEERKLREEAERKQRADEELRKQREKAELMQRLAEVRSKWNAKRPPGKELPPPWSSYLLAPKPLADPYTTMAPGFLMRQQPPDALDYCVVRKTEFAADDHGKFVIDSLRRPRPKYERPTVSAVDFVAELSGDTRVKRWRAGQCALPSAAKLKLIDEELARREASRSEMEKFFRRILGSIGAKW